jgi:hypothetical protein
MARQRSLERRNAVERREWLYAAGRLFEIGTPKE